VCVRACACAWVPAAAVSLPDNRAAVFGFKFPNKTIIDADFDCARQNELPEELNFRRPPQWVIDEGKRYTGPTGSAASHFKERTFHPKDKGQPGGAKA